MRRAAFPAHWEEPDAPRPLEAGTFREMSSGAHVVLGGGLVWIQNFQNVAAPERARVASAARASHREGNWCAADPLGAHAARPCCHCEVPLAAIGSLGDLMGEPADCGEVCRKLQPGCQYVFYYYYMLLANR